jgi:protein-disulfide isomerase
VFQGCLASRRFGALVDAQRRDAIERKMTGTPTFYVNGTRFDGTLSYADLERVFVQNGG